MAHFTFLELFEALEGNLKLVGCREGGRVVQDFDAKKRDDRHCERYAIYVGSISVRNG